ncbi:MAG: hypothetical protein M1343_13605 [Chloroflexi bacterium]|nr:hypothetical protein [Chloroflexota bacterium]MDA8187121.1 hypothetical protein [Dehalococcoidales bacterium]
MSQGANRDQLDTKTIAEAVRKTRFLDPVLKKRWLTLLPHMRDVERRELWSILTESEKQLDQLDSRSDVPR